MSTTFWLAFLAAQFALLAGIALVRMQRAESESRAALRDYLAAQALPGVLTTSWPDLHFKPINGLSAIENTAVLAYQVADAMLKARAAS